MAYAEAIGLGEQSCHMVVGAHDPGALSSKPMAGKGQDPIEIRAQGTDCVQHCCHMVVETIPAAGPIGG